MTQSRLVGVFEVLSDPKRIQRIAITCRCSLRWIEFIPQELHDSDLICRFTCSRCATQYVLYHKQLKRLTEGDIDVERLTEVKLTDTVDTNNKHQYDA